MTRSKIYILGLSFINILLTIGSFSAEGQAVCDFSDDYSDPSLWTSFYKLGTGCDNHSQTGILSITGGVVNYDSVIDANDTRLYRDLGFTVSDDSWIANFDFTPIEIGVDGTPRVLDVVFGLSQNNNGAYDDSTYICTLSNNDAIMAVYQSLYDPTPSTTGLFIAAKNGSTLYSSYATDLIVISPGSTYYCTLKRVSSTNVSLDVYSDSARTILFGSIGCFEIPAAINGLHILQHGNGPQGSYMRVLTGTVDNTCIYNNPAPAISIEGPSAICPEEFAAYSIPTADDIVWVLPAAVDYDVIDEDSIIVNDWGGLTSITIDAEVAEDCGIHTYSYEVEIVSGPETYISVSICSGSFAVIFGDTVTTSGLFSEIYPLASGCDSTSYVTVDVVDAFFTTTFASICEDDIYTLPDGVIVNDEGTYVTTIPSTGGCDSVITTNLSTILNDSLYISYVSCYGENYILPDGAIVNTSGNYISIITSALGCDSLVFTELNILPEVDTAIVNTDLCAGESYTLPDGDVVDNAGIYESLILNENGCDSLIITEINMKSSYNYSVDTVICYNQKFVMPDGTIISEPGIYQAYFETSEGCDSNISYNILIDLCDYWDVDIPNAFSPNEDGLNDIFSIIDIGACSLDILRIYDRWGEKIYETSDINAGWNGTFNGIDQEIGAYVYYAIIHCDGNEIFLTGSITLIR